MKVGRVTTINIVRGVIAEPQELTDPTRVLPQLPQIYARQDDHAQGAARL